MDSYVEGSPSPLKEKDPGEDEEEEEITVRTAISVLAFEKKYSIVQGPA